MKYLILLTSVSVFMVNAANSQNAYYDASRLKEYFKNGKFDPDKRSAIDSILARYISDPDDNPDVFKNTNPFTKDYFPNASPQSSLIGGLFGGSLASKVGGIPITNFADGLAKFLVKRFKEELTIAFFQKFKDEISKFEELKTLFPETYKLLLIIDKDIYKFSAYLNTLREAFIKDLTNLYTDFKKLTQLAKYKRYFHVDHPEAYTIIVSSLYFIDRFSRGAHPGEVLAKYDVGDLLFKNKSLEHNIRSSVLILQTFSASFKSLSTDHYWVPADSVKELLSNEIGLNIYFGLIYQKHGAISFYRTSSADSIRVDTLLARSKRQVDTLKGDINEYKNFIETLGDHAQEVNQYLSGIKGKKKEEIDFNDYYKFYNAAFDLLEFGLTFIDLPHVHLADTLENKLRDQSVKWLSVARNTGDLYIDIRTKNYSSAILNVADVLDTILLNYNDQYHIDSLTTKLRVFEDELKTEKNNTSDRVSGYDHKVNKAIQKFTKKENESPKQWLTERNIIDPDVTRFVDSIVFIKRNLKASDDKVKLKSTLIKYGSFAAAVAQAENSDDVEKAIESIALPAGSASIKKGSSWNIALNAYLGGFYGNEYLKESTGPKWAPIMGVYAPVGVTFTKGLNKWGSASLFLSAIDVGAFASFRLQDDTTKALPEVTLKNIFAPGAGIIYGLPWNLPVSVGWTWQMGPAVREFNIKPEEIDINASNGLNYRWQFFLAVDIPIVNFYTKSR